MLRRIVVSLAFSVCCFLNAWIEYAEGDLPYFARFAPLQASLPAVILWQALIAAAFFGVWEFCRRFRMTHSRWIEIGFLVSCAVPAGTSSVALMRAFPVDLVPIVRQPWFWPCALVCSLPVVVVFVAWPGVAGRWVRKLFLYASPVLALVVLQGFRTTLFKYPSSDYVDDPLAASVSSPPSSTRVVWIVFDELSQAITFDHRPAGLDLPEFDRLRAQSLHALAAHSPATSTKESLPALILGEPVLKAVAQGPKSLFLKTAACPEPFSWSSASNIFDQARKAGYNSAIAGWFHPYGRLLNRSLTKSTWTAGWLLSGVEEPSEPRPLAASMVDRAQLQIAALPLIGHIPGYFPAQFHRREKTKRFQSLLRSACDYAADRSLGLVLIHLPTPHPPAIYSRAEKRFSSGGRQGYLDGVALADLALGEIIRSIERAGLAGNTAIIVSADHGWRTAMWRGGPEWTAEEESASGGVDVSGVPFLVKLPRSTESVAYPAQFDTVITVRLIMGILESRIESTQQVVELLNSITAKNAAAPSGT